MAEDMHIHMDLNDVRDDYQLQLQKLPKHGEGFRDHKYFSLKKGTNFLSSQA